MKNLHSFSDFTSEAVVPALQPAPQSVPKPASLSPLPTPNNKGFVIKNAKYKTDTSEKFIAELLRIQKSMMGDFHLTLVEAQSLMRIAFGILFRESDAGNSLRYALRTIVGAFHVFGSAPSEGLTQVKFDINFGEKENNEYQQQNKRLVAKYKLSDESLSTPEGSARATFVLLSRLLNTAKLRKYTGDNLYKIVIIAYNIGANKVLAAPKHGKGADTLISQKVPNYIPDLKTDKSILQKGVPVHITTEGYYNEVVSVGKNISFT